MSINWQQLVSQGRAKAPSKAWEPEELEALLVLEKECELTRIEAANYVRNGITTPDAYRKAVEAKFEPQTLDAVTDQAIADLKLNGSQFEGTQEVTSDETVEVSSDEVVVGKAEVKRKKK